MTGSFARYKLDETLTDACPVRSVLDRIGDKWSVLLLSELETGPKRFGVLRRNITDISQRMLSTKLQSLQQDGFISRTVHPASPPAVEYALTDLGQSLLVPLHALKVWANSHHELVRAARMAYAQANDAAT